MRFRIGRVMMAMTCIVGVSPVERILCLMLCGMRNMAAVTRKRMW